MKIEKLRKIVGYNREHLDEMYLLSRHFSGNNGINDEPYINFVQMIRQALLNKKTILLYFPLKDMKIKALAMKSDYYKYIVINSNYSSSENANQWKDDWIYDEFREFYKNPLQK